MAYLEDRKLAPLVPVGGPCFSKISTSSHNDRIPGYRVCKFNNKATLVRSWGIVPRKLVFLGFEQLLEQLGMQLFSEFLSLQATSPVSIQ